MKKILAVGVVIAIILILWFLFFKPSGNTAESVASKKDTLARKHSPQLDREISRLVNSYLAVKDALGSADTEGVKKTTDSLMLAADSLHLNELQGQDSSLYLAVQQNVSDIKANAVPILKESDLAEMRRDFSMVSENMYPFLKTVGYEGPKLYWQNDPNAFGQDKPANWLNTSPGSANPYTGGNAQGNGHVAETMDSIF